MIVSVRRCASVRLAAFSRGVAAVALFSLLPGFAATLYSPAGISVSVDAGGTYAVSVANPSWQFSGTLGRPLGGISITPGTDSLGGYTEATFNYVVDGPRRGAIRAYLNQRVVLFTDFYDAPALNASPFPVFTKYPAMPYHVTFSGMFSLASFPGWAPESPWFFWDARSNAFAISPADHFMTAATTWNAAQNLVSGISSTIATLPAGFSHKTLLVIDQGINQTIQSWGDTMLGMSSKTRPANDADAVLRQLGYWTDNGAAYYYKQENGLSVTETLNAVKSTFDRMGIQLGYMQLDSWFYPKGANQDWRFSENGIYLYEAAPAIFPDGLANFQQNLGVPLVTHARWIDSSSPYRSQFQMSGNVSIDPAYWRTVGNYLRDSGVIMYEQDWMGLRAMPNFNLDDPDAFLNNMANANAHMGIDMQYCMATPRHFMHSLRFSNLTTARASEDRFDRNRWTNFLYGSRFASALGIWPFSDVFMSGETQNLIMAVLSAGPLGVGDPIGALNRDNLLSAVRADGVIVKPDMPLIPVDASYFSNSGGDLTQPMVASTYSDFDGLKAIYVIAYDQGKGKYPLLHYSDLGLTSPGYLYEPLTDILTIVHPGESFVAPPDGFSFRILMPEGLSGITFLGDRGQFAALGKQRIKSLHDDGAVHVSVAFAASETVRTLHGVSPQPPAIKMISGTLKHKTYDAWSHRFTITVSAGPHNIASMRIVPTSSLRIHPTPLP